MANCTNLQRDENGEYLDSITLEPIPPERLFTLRREGREYCYDVVALNNYLQNANRVALLPDVRLPIFEEEEREIQQRARDLVVPQESVRVAPQQAPRGLRGRRILPSHEGYLYELIPIPGQGIRCQSIVGPAEALPCPENVQIVLDVAQEAGLNIPPGGVRPQPRQFRSVDGQDYELIPLPGLGVRCRLPDIGLVPCPRDVRMVLEVDREAHGVPPVRV